MTLLSSADEIWELAPTKEDLEAGARYAAISLPWTFNRMNAGSASKNQQERATRITKGIVAQEMLRRALRAKGIEPQIDRTDYRSKDMFDFELDLNGTRSRLDLKTINYYTNYAPMGRSPLTSNLIIDNADYGGPDWRHFFPALVPVDQLSQDKQAYAFAIAASIDFRRDMTTNRPWHSMTSFPYGPEWMTFVGSTKLIKAREQETQGFYVRFFYQGAGMFDPTAIHLTVRGEWDAQLQEIEINLPRNGVAENVGPFSSLLSFHLPFEEYGRFEGRILITVSQNNFTSRIDNSLRRNLNTLPTEDLVLSKVDFCNLMLPSDYRMFFSGWIMKEQFLEMCRNYTGWVWPKNSINPYENQAWSQITEDDRRKMESAGFDDCIERGLPIQAGMMKTTGRGGGACCYVFPNIGSMGGVKDTNSFVLPQDLHIMATLGE